MAKLLRLTLDTIMLYLCNDLNHETPDFFQNPGYFLPLGFKNTGIEKWYSLRSEISVGDFVLT
jgi:hypothetical protein